MQPADELIGDGDKDNSKYCLAKPGDVYLVYIAKGVPVSLDLSNVKGNFSVQWFNPRSGGALENGTVLQVSARAAVSLGSPPKDLDKDWLAVIRAAM